MTFLLLEVSEDVIRSRLSRARAHFQRYFDKRCSWLHPGDGNARVSLQIDVGFGDVNGYTRENTIERPSYPAHQRPLGMPRGHQNFPETSHYLSCRETCAPRLRNRGRRLDEGACRLPSGWGSVPFARVLPISPAIKASWFWSSVMANAWTSTRKSPRKPGCC